MIGVRGKGIGAFALLLTTVFAGCGPSPVRPLREDTRSVLRGASVRVYALHPWQKIVQSELVYKGLWNDHNFRVFATEGIWDPGPAMEKLATPVLADRAGILGTPLRSQLDPKTFAAFHKATMEGVQNNVRDVGMGALLQPVGEPYLSLKSQGIEYLLELILEVVLVHCNSCFPARFAIDVTGRLVRISDGAVLWAERGGSSVSIPGLAYFSDLEKNDLALMKNRFDEAMKTLLSPSHPFLRGLARPD